MFCRAEAGQTLDAHGNGAAGALSSGCGVAGQRDGGSGRFARPDRIVGICARNG
ncbi:hypothetical protein DESC_760034 [Desulfosarcina cetonica]|nr:hypothetical protein DESC_760034 [Desulfosarcina cetonica]